MRREKEAESEKEKEKEHVNEKEKERDKEILREKNKERKVSFFANESDAKIVLYFNQPIIVLLYKEAYLIIKNLNTFLFGVLSSLLQEFDDLFLKEILH